MEKIRKYILTIVFFTILIISILIRPRTEYFLVRDFNLLVATILMFGLLILLLIGKVIEIHGYDIASIEAMKKHEVINALSKKNNLIVLGLFFPMIMTIEELVFRYYLIGFLLKELKLETFSAIFISSLVFSLYHIHIWFSYKNFRILFIYLGYSFLLGLFNGYIFTTLGIFSCILIHYSLVFYMYYNIYRRYFKVNK